MHLGSAQGANFQGGTDARAQQPRCVRARWLADLAGPRRANSELVAVADTDLYK